MQVCIQSLILSRQIVVFLLVHFLINDILLGDPKSATSTLLVDLRCSSRRLYAGFKTAITAARRSNVRALLVFLMSTFRLDRLRGGEGPAFDRHG